MDTVSSSTNRPCSSNAATSSSAPPKSLAGKERLIEIAFMTFCQPSNSNTQKLISSLNQIEDSNGILVKIAEHSLGENSDFAVALRRNHLSKISTPPPPSITCAENLTVGTDLESLRKKENLIKILLQRFYSGPNADPKALESIIKKMDSEICRDLLSKIVNSTLGESSPLAIALQKRNESDPCTLSPVNVAEEDVAEIISSPSLNINVVRPSPLHLQIRKEAKQIVHPFIKPTLNLKIEESNFPLLPPHVLLAVNIKKEAQQIMDAFIHSGLEQAKAVIDIMEIKDGNKSKERIFLQKLRRLSVIEKLFINNGKEKAEQFLKAFPMEGLQELAENNLFHKKK